MERIYIFFFKFYKQKFYFLYKDAFYYCTEKGNILGNLIINEKMVKFDPSI